MERTNLATLEIAGKAQIGTESEAEVTFPTYVEAVTAFGESLLAKSPRTRTNYLSALNRFREFLVSLGWQPDAIRTDIFPPEILEQFYTWLLKINGRERRSTAVAYVSEVRAFFRFLDRRRWLRPDLSYEHMKDGLRELIGRLHYKTPRVDDAIALIVTTAKNHPIGPNDGRTLAQRLELLRDRAILTTLYATGMRREELSHLNRTDIQDGRVDEGLVTGKGGKERVVFFDEASLTAIRAYLAARNDTYLPLFLRHDAGRGKAGLHGERWRLSPQSIWGVVKKYSRLANVNATTHHLRHLKARVLLNNGAQLSEVQDILGHASPETTKKIYAPYTKQHLREAFDRFSLSAEDIARRARRTPDAE
ncbi:MAG TPA: tyrosine-type recombinase/integrase [Chloroflexota bacterium]|nr:tyrosine-type recombinase/integrase [Chloroflexota bacterium]